MNTGKIRRDALASSYRIAISNGKNLTPNNNQLTNTLDIINLVDDNRCESLDSISTHPSWVGLPETPFNSPNCTNSKKLFPFAFAFNTRYFIFFLVWIATAAALILTTVFFVGKYHRDQFEGQIDSLITEIEKISIEKRSIESDLEEMATKFSECEDIRNKVLDAMGVVYQN